MSNAKSKSRAPVESGGDRKNDSGLRPVSTSAMIRLPMGSSKKPGRKPKGHSPFTKIFANLLLEKHCSHIAEIFDVEEHAELSGIFLIEAKPLRVWQ
jgi:hypothetical protein